MFERSQLWNNGGVEFFESFRVFESPRDFADHCAKLPAQIKKGREEHDPKWSGASRFADVEAWLRDGKPSCVAPSDALLTRFDDLQFVSRKSAIVPAVSGGAPNVGAFLAGSPVAMRQRVKTISDAAPLRIIADPSSSADIKKETLERRGAAVLALVRMLSAVRPVELYCGFSSYCPQTVHGKHSAHYELVRIDTSPLDLIRAAYLLADVSAARCGLYASALEYVTNGKGGTSLNWGYNSADNSRKRFCDAVNRMFADGAETLYIAPPFSDDKSMNDPEKFIREKLAEYGGTPVAEAA